MTDLRDEMSRTKKMAIIAIFGAMAGALMCVEFPLTFIAPDFYKIDLGDLPAIIGSFMMGPVAGVLIEAIKILIKLIFKPTSTAYVGEFANFCVGCALVLPAGLIYKFKRTRLGSIIALICGTIFMGVAGLLLNYYLMLPFYEKSMNFPTSAVVGIAHGINSAINSKWDFVLLSVLPFNLIKGVFVSVITEAVYKRLSILIKNIGPRKSKVTQ